MTELNAVPNGPIIVKGTATWTDADGNEQVNEGKVGSVALCRCGLSKSKPFCDGSHNGNFEADPTNIVIND